MEAWDVVVDLHHKLSLFSNFVMVYGECETFKPHDGK